MRRRPERWQTRFGGWVGRFTVRRIVAELSARDLAVDATSVYSWLSGRATPRPPRAMALVEMSAGVLRLEDVYGQRKITTGARS